MKKVFLALFSILFVTAGRAQMVNNPHISSDDSARNLISGVTAIDDGLQFSRNFADTLAVNSFIGGRLKGIAGLQVRTGDSIWMRSYDAKKWLLKGATPVNYTGSNGIIKVGGDFQLGGELNSATHIDGTANEMFWDNVNGYYISNNLKVGDNGSGVTSCAVGEFVSTTQGLLPPRMNTTQQNSIPTPVAGLIIWNTDSLTICKYDGYTWRKLGSNTTINNYRNKIGYIVSDTFNRSSLGGNYTSSLVTATITFPSSAKMNITGGNGTYANYIEYNTYLDYEQFSEKLVVIPKTLSSTSAIAFGVYSQNVNVFGIIAKLDISSNSSNSGKITLYQDNGSTLMATSSTGFIVAAGDTIVFKPVRYKDQLSVTAYNKTQGVTSIVTYVPTSQNATITLPNINKIRLYSLGGTQDFTLLQYYCPLVKGKRATFVGNSITQGYGATAWANRPADIVYGQNYNVYNIDCGGGETSANVISKLNNIIALGTQYAVLEIGTNDLGTSVSQATWAANIDTITVRLLRAGVTPIWLSLPPFNGNMNVPTWNTNLQSICTSRSVKYVDTYTALTGGSGFSYLSQYNYDNTHPNDAGYGVIAGKITILCPELFAGITQDTVSLDNTPYAQTTSFLGVNNKGQIVKSLSASGSSSVTSTSDQITVSSNVISGLSTTSTPQFTKLGIGQAAGTYPLEVTTTSISAPAAVFTGVGQTLWLKATNPYIEFYPTSGGRYGWSGYGINSTDYYFSNDVNGPMHFATNGYANIRMTIAAGGNVGIGNTSPSAKLHVTGNGYFTTDLQVDGTTALQSDATVGGQLSITGHTNLSSDLVTNASSGTSGYLLSSRGSGLSPNWVPATFPINNLLGATSSNDINHANFPQAWRWNSLSNQTGLALVSNSTAAASNGQMVLNVNLSGANSNSTQTTYSAGFDNSHTGTSSTNVAAYFNAVAGTTNYAAQFLRGKISLGTVGTEKGIVEINGSTTGTITLQPQGAAGTYNWNWPTTAGSSGDYLTSGGGSSSAMTWTTPAGVSAYTHNISTPTTGGTVTLVKNQYNIINPAGALLALTVNLPSSPANNDVVYIKFTQNVTTVTYGNGTVVDGITAPTAGGLTVLVYDAGTTSWY